MSPRVSAHRDPRRRLGVGLLLLGLVAALPAVPRDKPAPPQLPPLQASASSEHHPGKVVWMDLVTPDLAGAQRFYGGVFGWTFQDVAGARVPYAIALDDGAPVAGIVQPRAHRNGRRQPAWLPYFAAANLRSTRQQAVTHGAKMLSKPRLYPSRGEQVVLKDPQGAVFGVLVSSSGDPPDELADPGEWIWASLLTTNPQGGSDFYRQLFGYDVEPLPGKDGGSHWLLSSDGYARASVNSISEHAGRESPYWLAFVRVLDTEAAVAKVKSLGGSVLTEPHPDRDGGIVAVVADPAGTPFGLLEWRDSEANAGGGIPR